MFGLLRSLPARLPAVLVSELPFRKRRPTNSSNTCNTRVRYFPLFLLEDVIGYALERMPGSPGGAPGAKGPSRVPQRLY